MYEIVADPNHCLIPGITSNTNDDYNDNDNKNSNNNDNKNDENNSKYKMIMT